MKILFICDLNSSHARSWVRYFIKRGHEVALYSSTAVSGMFEGVPIHTAPEAPASITPETGWGAIARGLVRFSWLTPALEFAQLAMKKRNYLHQAISQAHTVLNLVQTFQPDVVHSLRIPFEGFLGANIDSSVPLVVSIWGNDLIFFAAEDRRFEAETRRTLKRCDLLMADCRRDLQLAQKFGFDGHKPTLVVPGAGGIPRYALESARTWLTRRNTTFDDARLSERTLVLFNPRGFGNQSLTNVPLLHALRLVLDDGADVALVIAGRLQTYRAEHLRNIARRLKLETRVQLIQELPPRDMVNAYTAADCFISPMHHDGIPNSLIEAMAFGAVPIVSGLDSIKEWLQDGENAFLFDSRDAKSIAAAIRRAVNERNRFEEIRAKNHAYVSAHAVYEDCMLRAEQALIALVEGHRDTRHVRGSTTSTRQQN